MGSAPKCQSIQKPRTGSAGQQGEISRKNREQKKRILCLHFYRDSLRQSIPANPAWGTTGQMKARARKKKVDKATIRRRKAKRTMQSGGY